MIPSVVFHKDLNNNEAFCTLFWKQSKSASKTQECGGDAEMFAK